MAGLGHAKEVRAHLGRVSDVIDVAEMDRIVRPPGFDKRCDFGRFVGAGSPIAREPDAGVAAEAVDSVISVLAIICLKSMSPTDSESPIFAHPPPKSVRREGGEGWIG